MKSFQKFHAVPTTAYPFCLFAMWLIVSICSLAQTQLATAATVGQGHVDSISIESRRVSVQGWAAAEHASQRITAITVLLQGKLVYTGSFERFARADVADALKRPEWLGSGWRVSFELPEVIEPGTLDVMANARTGDGQLITLIPSASAGHLTVMQTGNQERTLIRSVKWIIACTILLLTIVFIKASPLSAWFNKTLKVSLSEPLLFSTAVMLVGLLFVSLGLTGSSLSLGQSAAPFLNMNGTPIMAHDQPIRSDEWLVLTPLAIAQYNHEPRFPVLNRNLGEDGQNMLIVGMTGVPVAHLSAIAKPATWGFFIFDLRRALSWNWCFSIVGCFLALAFVLNTLSRTHWKHGFLFSALFCCAPYVVAWSNWPAYTVFFPCVMFLCVVHMLKTSSPYTLLLLAGLSGVAGAGFVFVLYPPWQVSVGYVFLALTVGVFIRDRLYKQLTLSRISACAVAIAITASLVTVWWIDASSAIHAMEQTVYPGRRLSTGGEATLSGLLRGFTNISTLVQLKSTFSNQSEIASFFYYLLPLGTLFIICAIRRALTAVEWSIAGSVGFIVLFMFFGLSAALSRYSLWGYVPVPRADLSLGLATLMLTHLLLASHTSALKHSQLTTFVAAGVALVWTYLVYRAIGGLDNTLTDGINSSQIIALMFMVAAISYCLITSHFKPFIFMSLGLSLASTVSFNPVNIAPTSVQFDVNDRPSGELKRLVHGKKVLVMENGVTPMFLAAAGVSVVNGVFYYPQTSLWARLDPLGKKSAAYNRYQHLHFVGEDVLAEDFKLGTPQADVVSVTLDLRRFDFRLSGAQIILAPDTEKNALAQNPSLSFLLSAQGWCWFTTPL